MRGGRVQCTHDEVELPGARCVLVQELLRLPRVRVREVHAQRAGILVSEGEGAVHVDGFFLYDVTAMLGGEPDDRP